MIDIWSPKDHWLQYFVEQNILHLFEAISFSSDHGYVKPAPYGFELVLKIMQLQADQVVFVGDSVQRDLAGAHTAGMDCILVGAEQSSAALAQFPNLLGVCQTIFDS